VGNYWDGDMDGWVVPESKPCSCGGTEDTGHRRGCPMLEPLDDRDWTTEQHESVFGVMGQG
jgi:hypothetical protein